MMSKNDRMFIRIPKGSNDFKDARVFRGRGNLILSLLQNKYHLDEFFNYYDILEITSVNTKEPVENFKELIENWKGYKEFKEDESPKIVREDKNEFTKKELFQKLYDGPSSFDKNIHYVEGRAGSSRNWP